jgi:hypothetical protein
VGLLLARRSLKLQQLAMIIDAPVLADRTSGILSAALDVFGLNRERHGKRFAGSNPFRRPSV